MKETDTKRISFDEMPAAMATMMEDIRQIKNSLLHPDEPVQKKRDPISFERACEIVGKAKNTMYRYTSQGLIPHYKRGKTVYFFEDELMAWVREGKCESIDERLAEAEKHIVQLAPKSRR